MHREEMTGAGRRYRGSRVLLGLAVVSVLVQLYGLYRPAGPPNASWLPWSDKLAHLVGFAVPVCLLLLFGGVGRRLVLSVVGVFALHALVSEVVQHYLYASRTGDPYDVLADLLGITLGWGAASLLDGAASTRNAVRGEPSRTRTP